MTLGGQLFKKSCPSIDLWLGQPIIMFYLIMRFDQMAGMRFKHRNVIALSRQLALCICFVTPALLESLQKNNPCSGRGRKILNKLSLYSCSGDFHKAVSDLSNQRRAYRCGTVPEFHRLPAI